MAVEWPVPLELLIYGPVAIGGIAVLVRLAPRLAGWLRQRAYDRAGEAEIAEWLLRVDPTAADDPDAARRLIAGLHPGLRRGFDAWHRGWPRIGLAVVVDGGPAQWRIRAPRQLARAIEAAVASAYPTADLERIEPTGWPPAVLSLAVTGSAPSERRGRTQSSLTSALVECLARLPSAGAARWRVDLRPTAAAGASNEGGPSLAGEVLRSFLGQPSRPPPSPREARPAASGGPWFDARVSLEVWLPAASAGPGCSMPPAWSATCRPTAGRSALASADGRNRCGSRPGRSPNCGGHRAKPTFRERSTSSAHAACRRPRRCTPASGASAATQGATCWRRPTCSCATPPSSGAPARARAPSCWRWPPTTWPPGAASPSSTPTATRWPACSTPCRPSRSSASTCSSSVSGPDRGPSTRSNWPAPTRSWWPGSSSTPWPTCIRVTRGPSRPTTCATHC